MARQINVLKELSSWSKQGNSTMQLSVSLGYKSNVAAHWLRVGRIPGHMESRVLELIGKTK